MTAVATGRETVEGAFPALITSAHLADHAELLDAFRATMYDPSVLTADREPFFFPAEISSNRIDSYFTRMHPTTLNNFASDASRRVSLQDSHDTRKLGYGRSILARVETLPGKGDDGQDLVRALAEFAIVPGQNLNGRPTDDIIDGIKWGQIFDVSVGFYGGEMRCSLCNRDLWDWDCPHIPGVKYTQLDEDGNEREPELAIAWIIDSHLAETSLVYDGATPGASILKAQREASAGRIRPETARMIEQRYRKLGVKLPILSEGRTVHDMAAPEPISTEQREEEETPVADLNATTNAETRATGTEPAPANPPQPAPEPAPAPQPAPTAPAQPEQQRSPATSTITLDIATLPLPADFRSVMERSGIQLGDGTVLGTMRGLIDELVRLKPLADDGVAAKARLIDETMEMGGRALGTDFREEQVRATLNKLTFDEIAVQRDGYRVIVDKVFKGGRATTDPDAEEIVEEPTEQRQSTNSFGLSLKRFNHIETPDHAYAG